MHARTDPSHSDIYLLHTYNRRRIRGWDTRFSRKTRPAETQFNLLLTGNGLGMGVQSAGTLIISLIWVSFQCQVYLNHIRTGACCTFYYKGSSWDPLERTDCGCPPWSWDTGEYI